MISKIYEHIVSAMQLKAQKRPNVTMITTEFIYKKCDVE